MSADIKKLEISKLISLTQLFKKFDRDVCDSIIKDNVPLNLHQSTIISLIMILSYNRSGIVLLFRMIEKSN